LQRLDRGEETHFLTGGAIDFARRDRCATNPPARGESDSTPRLLIEKAMLPAWAIPVSFIETGISGSPVTDNANSTLRWIVNRP
jgi:hypothetical protein